MQDSSLPLPLPKVRGSQSLLLGLLFKHFDRWFFTRSWRKISSQWPSNGSFCLWVLLCGVGRVSTAETPITAPGLAKTRPLWYLPHLSAVIQSPWFSLLFFSLRTMTFLKAHTQKNPQIPKTKQKKISWTKASFIPCAWLSSCSEHLTWHNYLFFCLGAEVIVVINLFWKCCMQNHT